MPYLLSHLPSWLMLVVSFSRDADDEAEAAWWPMLIIDACWVGVFVEVASLWQDGSFVFNVRWWTGGILSPSVWPGYA